MKNIYHSILEEIRAGSAFVLATVVNTAGSTPQKAGSSALFGAQGLLAGTVGGGMMEDEIQRIAESVLISGISNHYYFNLDSEPGSEGAICGGEAVVLVDANPDKHLACLEEMERSLSSRTPGFLFTLVGRENEQERSIRRHWINIDKTEDLPGSPGSDFQELVKAHYKPAVRYGFARIDLQTIPDQEAEFAFLEHIKPMPELVIVGGGHIGKALAHLGSLLEFEVTVMDDRPEFASREHIPDADKLVVKEIGPAMHELNPGADTYIVIVTRGHTQDAEALRACIGSEAAYIGMIGSRNKVGTLKKQFLDEGWATPEQWSAIYAPVGLHIGSQTVQEIATSIAAQLVEVRNRKTAPHGK